MTSSRRWRPSTLALASIVACAEPPLDTTRQTDPRGTLGEEVFKLIDRDLVRDTPDRAVGFELAKPGFVGAIDHLFPGPELSRDQDFLVRLLPLYDDGSIPALTRRFSAMTARLAADHDAVAALAALENRAGYVDLSHEEALARRIANYPKYRPLTSAVIDLALAHDGLDDQGQPLAGEDDCITRLLGAMAGKMRDLQLSEDTERDAVFLADLMLSEDTRLAPPASSSTAAVAQVVARDVRGMAKVQAPARGAVPAPFVDIDPQDGLPDVDAAGRFVDASGRPIDLAPFGKDGMRDQMARAINAPNGTPIYQYVALERTVAAGLLRDTRQLIADGIPKKAIDSFETLLGGRSAEGSYVAVNSRLMDLAHAAGTSMDLAVLPDLLQLFGILLNQHEGELGYLAEETEKQLDIADRYNVSLAPGSTFFDDLMSVVRKILLQPGLAEGLVGLLENDPALLGFPAAEASLMGHKKMLITKADFDAGTVLDTAVDRSQPDTRANQSLHQRMLHLIHDTKGARYEPHLIGIPLGFIFEIPDLAEFYMDSLIGQAQVPSLVSTLTGLPTQPTPEDLAVFINSDQAFGNPQGNEGIDVKDNDADTLFAVPPSGMKNALKPLVQLFHDQNQMALLFELFEVMHKHYASKAGGDYQNTDGNAPRYSLLSGLCNYEPLLIDSFTNADLFKATKNLLVNSSATQTTGGKSSRDLLLAFGRKFIGKDQNLTTMDGHREVMVNGQRVSPLSPFDLVRGARSGVTDIMRRSATTQSDWNALISELHDQFVATQLAGPEQGRFVNTRMIPIATITLSFLEQRARKHLAANDLSHWALNEIPDAVSDFITSTELPAAIDLYHVIDNDPALSGMLIELRDQLFAEDQGFGELLATLGDELGSLKDASITLPFAHFLGAELDPSKQLLFAMLMHGKQCIAADPDQHMLEVARRGIEVAPDGGLFLSGLGRAIKQANRSDPRNAGALDAEDVRKIVLEVSTYLADDQHGIEKFYKIVAGRK